MTNHAWSLLVAVVAFTLGVVSGPAPMRGQGAETTGVITEIKIGRGTVEVRSGSADWRVAAPLGSLRAGDQIRAAADAVAVVLLTGGRGTVRVAASNSPYTVPAAPVDGKVDRAKALLASSLGFLAASSKEPPKAVLSTRSTARPPEILTPRNGPVLPESLVFEWQGSQFSRYTVRIMDPAGVVLERKGVVGARFSYPADAPELTPAVRYRFQVEALGRRPYETWFELVDRQRAAEVQQGLEQLQSSLGPGTSASSLAIAKIGTLAADGYFHDARLVALSALASDPDEPTLHIVLANLYLKTGLPRLAAESMDEARFLMSRDPR